MRPLHPVDLARYALLGGPAKANVAWTLDSLGRDDRRRPTIAEAARLGLAIQGKGPCAYCDTDGGRVTGLVVARRRSGPTAWEINHLAAEHDDDGLCVDLLSGVCREVARRGGQRVFLRLRHAEPLVNAARLSGFTLCDEETLYVGRRLRSERVPSVEVRRKDAHDDYGLFRLYNATTPYEARLVVGSTFDQWRSARERSRGRSREFVFERDGRVTAWVLAARWRGTGHLSIVAGPEEGEALGALMDAGLERMTGVGTVLCLVPAHQVLTQRLLVQRGYQAASKYLTLGRSMAAPAHKETFRRAVTTAPT